LVAIQQPDDLDAAFTMALLYEELGDGTETMASKHSYTPIYRRSPVNSHTPISAPPPPPPAKWVSKSVEEKRQYGNQRYGTDDKWSSFKAYRIARGLCFVCGEKWGREHVCRPSIQLHVVQEMLDCFQPVENDDASLLETPKALPQQLMQISTLADAQTLPGAKSMRI
jgi:hypothetical protein